MKFKDSLKREPKCLHSLLIVKDDFKVSSLSQQNGVAVSQDGEDHEKSESEGTLRSSVWKMIKLSSYEMSSN